MKRKVVEMEWGCRSGSTWAARFTGSPIEGRTPFVSRARPLAAALCLMSSLGAPMVEASTQGDWCEQQWEIVSGDPSEGLQPSYKDILARWQQYGGKCAGSVAYEARLAILYAQMNEPAKAREVLKKGTSFRAIPC